MSCKCGATVKAGECAVGITRFQVNEIRHFAQCAPASRNARLPGGNLTAETATSAYWRKTGQESGRPIRQDRGTIAVGWDSIAPGDDESRSPRR